MAAEKRLNFMIDTIRSRRITRSTAALATKNGARLTTTTTRSISPIGEKMKRQRFCQGEPGPSRSGAAKIRPAYSSRKTSPKMNSAIRISS